MIGLNLTIYRKYNDDLKHFNDDELEEHFYLHGQYENRIYKLSDIMNNIDLDLTIYKIYNDDLKDFNDDELEEHFYLHGQYENRIYKLTDVTNNVDLDLNIYRIFNDDLKHFSDYELKKHFYLYGQYENRIFNENLLLDKFRYLQINHSEKIKIYHTLYLLENNNFIVDNINVDYISNFDLCHVLDINIPENTIFDEYKNYFKNNNIHYFDDYYNLDIHRNYFFWLKRSIEEKNIKIRSPFSNNIISTDIYFITLQDTDIMREPYSSCNYYFLEENLIVGIGLGSGLGAMSCSRILYIIDLFNNRIIYNWIDNDFKNFKEIMLVKIYNFISTQYLDLYNKNEFIITTIYGYMNNLGHNLFNDITGLFLIDHFNVTNHINNVIIGKYDPYHIYNYFKDKNIHIDSSHENIQYLDKTCGKGIFFKYNHYFISDKCIFFLKDYLLRLNDNREIIKDEIDNIKKKCYPIFNIVLREGGYKIRNQNEYLTYTINNILKIFPNAFFFFDGFCRNKNLDEESYIGASPSIIKVKDVINEYNNTFDAIIKNINTDNVKSLINKNSYEIIEFLSICDFTLYNIGSSCTISGWICNIPGIQYGRDRVSIYENMDRNIKQNNPHIIYLDNFYDYIDINNFSNIVINKINEKFL
jgi:hypothetical protein